MTGMSLSLKDLNVITLFTEDLAGTMFFYQEVLGLPVMGDYEDSAVLKLGNVMINLAHVSAAPKFGAAAGVANPGTGTRSVLAVFVDDVDAACASWHGTAWPCSMARSTGRGCPHRHLHRPRRPCLGARPGPRAGRDARGFARHGPGVGGGRPPRCATPERRVHVARPELQTRLVPRSSARPATGEETGRAARGVRMKRSIEGVPDLFPHVPWA